MKANREISHQHKLKIDPSAVAFDTRKRICRTLEAKVMLIQTPGSFTPDYFEDAYEFFRMVEKGVITLVWETRGDSWEKTRVRCELRRFLEELDISHVTDPFRVMPVCAGQVAYFRHHELGKRMYYYQYRDRELEKLSENIKRFDSSGRDIYVLSINLSMFEDAR